MKSCSVGKWLVIQRGTDGEILAVACLQFLLEPFFRLLLVERDTGNVYLDIKGKPLTN